MISAWDVDHGVSKSFIPGKGYVPASKLSKVTLHSLTGTSGRMQKEMALEREQKHWAEYKDQYAVLNSIVRDLKHGTPLKSSNTHRKNLVSYQPGIKLQSQMSRSNMEAFAVTRGGRRGSRIMVIPKGSNNSSTLNHEIAHLTPKRTSYRLHQISISGPKAMREEARADMQSGNPGDYYRKFNPKVSNSGYAQSAVDSEAQFSNNLNEIGIPRDQKKFTDESLKNYREVQDKIARARGITPAKPIAQDNPQPAFHGNQYVDEQKVKKPRRGTLVAIGGATGVGGYTAYRYHRKKKP